MRHLTAADAVMLLPQTIDHERLCQAIAWLGISRDVIHTMTGMTIEPDRVTFEVAIDGPGRRRVTVEARVTP